MQLGADIISIEIDGEAIELRPSLRACLRLVRRHGLPALYAAVQDFHTTILQDVLNEAASKPVDLPAQIAANGLRAMQSQLTRPLIALVFAIAGYDPAAPATPTTGAPISPEQFHTSLFEIATGWIGWTQDQAWHATPAEIIAAKSGRINLVTDILKAAFGTADEPAKPYTEPSIDPDTGLDPAFDRAGLQALKARLQGSR